MSPQLPDNIPRALPNGQEGVKTDAETENNWPLKDKDNQGNFVPRPTPFHPFTMTMFFYFDKTQIASRTVITDAPQLENFPSTLIILENHAFKTRKG